jgi:TonB family protein
MRTPRFFLCLTAATAMLATSAVPAFAQDAIARAKTLYASASFDEALAALASMNGGVSLDEKREIGALQAFCFYALGRNDEAKKAIEAVVKIDPVYHPSMSEISPRVRGFYEDTRKPLLPEIVKERYTSAKEAFERKEMSVAADGFDLVIALIDEAPAAGSSDMRTLSSGFRDLAKAAIPPPTPPPAPPAPDPKPMAPPTDSAPKTASAPENRVYTPDDPDIVKPVALTRNMPTWTPANAFEAKQTFRGTMELLLDEKGKVTSVTMSKSVRPSYDAELVKAAASWTFKPAMRRGVPVRYIYRIEIQVGRSPQQK